MQQTGLTQRTQETKQKFNKDRRVSLISSSKHQLEKTPLQNMKLEQEIDDFFKQLNSESIRQLATAFKHQYQTL